MKSKFSKRNIKDTTIKESPELKPKKFRSKQNHGLDAFGNAANVEISELQDFYREHSVKNSFVEEKEYSFDMEAYLKVLEQSEKTKKRPLMHIISVIVFVVVTVAISSIILMKSNDLDIKNKANDSEIKGAPVITIKNRPSADNNFVTTADALTVPEIVQKTSSGIVGVVQYNKNQTATNAVKGSGIVLSRNGYILTSSHLITQADGMNIVLSNGNQYQGFLIGADSLSDLAVVKINCNELIVPDFGDAENLISGENIVALGHSDESLNKIFVSTGVVSALVKNKVTQGGISISCIQTDASICEQNTGGALLNMQGQIVGILSSKLSNVKTESFGYAVDISQAKSIINDLVNYGFVKNRARLGITTQAVDDVMIKVYGVKKGLYVLNVDKESDAFTSGLKKGDVITAINGNDIGDNTELSKILYSYNPGDKITLTVDQADKYGKTTTTVITVALMEETHS